VLERHKLSDWFPAIPEILKSSLVYAYFHIHQSAT